MPSARCVKRTHAQNRQAEDVSSFPKENGHGAPHRRRPTATPILRRRAPEDRQIGAFRAVRRVTARQLQSAPGGFRPPGDAFPPPRLTLEGIHHTVSNAARAQVDEVVGGRVGAARPRILRDRWRCRGTRLKRPPSIRPACAAGVRRPSDRWRQSGGGPGFRNARRISRPIRYCRHHGTNTRKAWSHLADAPWKQSPKGV